jgi:hypothetical protein
MGNEIKIIIGGDASQLTAAAKEAGEAMGSFTGLTNQTSSALRKVAAESSKTADALKKIPASAENLIPEGSVLEARETVKRLRQEIESLTGKQLKSDAGRFLASEFKIAEDELRKLEVEAGLAKEKVEKIIPSKLPLGAIEEARVKIKNLQSQITSLNLTQIKSGAGKAIAADIKVAEKELITLEAQAGLTSATSGNLFKQAFGGLRTIANILPGIGVAGLIGFATEPIINYVSSLIGVSSEAKKAKEAAEEFAKSIRSVNAIQGEAAASQEGQIAQVQALANVVRDSNKPYAQRKRALEELKEINKSYFGDLQIEDAATGKLTKTVNAYADALINAAVQKEFSSEIASLAKEVVKQDAVIAASRLKVAQAQNAVTEAENKLATAVDKRINNESQSTRIINLTDNLTAAKNKLATANSELSNENSKVTTLLVSEALAHDQLNKTVEEGTKIKKLETEHTGKEEDVLKKRLEALEKIKAATKDAGQLVGIQESIFELQVKIAVRDQGKNQLSKGELDQQINGFKNELNNAFKNQAIELEAIPKVKFSQVILADINQKDISSVIAKATGLDKKITIPTQFDIDLKLFGKDFADKREAIRKQAVAVVDSLAKGIQDAVVQGSEVIGQAFAGLFSGDGVTNVLAKAAQGLLGIVGGILQEVGRQIIITSTLVAALKKALQGLFGPGGELIGIAVGAALIATGALLKNIKFDVPKLAKGGIATSATLGIFGEKGPEAILPLSKLPSMLGDLSMNTNSNVTLAPTIRISLTDLELGLERVRSSRRRLG